MKCEGYGGNRGAACVKEMGQHYTGGKLTRLRRANKNFSQLGYNLGQESNPESSKCEETALITQSRHSKTLLIKYKMLSNLYINSASCS
jgi:hypothetical protein